MACSINLYDNYKCVLIHEMSESAQHHHKCRVNVSIGWLSYDSSPLSVSSARCMHHVCFFLGAWDPGVYIGTW